MVRLTALLLTVATGFAGLVYEVAWQKYLAALLGSHAEATAAVLAIFLGGLSLGYALFGRATRRLVERARGGGRPPRLLYFYALVEGGIGIYAFLFPLLFSLAQYLSLLAPVGQAGLAFAFDVLLSALLIGPPAVLMGGTIPVLTLALAGDVAHSTRVHAQIYGSNTVGAFLGALAGGFFLVPGLGLDGSVYAMGCVNLVSAALFARLDRAAASVTPNLSEPAAEAPVARFAGWAAVALLAGFAMMALQASLNRIGALAFGASQFTFASIVAVFVLCIALGSLAVSALPRIPGWLVVGSQWALLLLLFPLYQVLADAPYWAHVVRVLFRPVDPAFYVYELLNFAGMLAVLALPVGLSGALLPLLFHALRREARDLGAVAGRLYAWNTVGSLLGALLGGYVLLFWLDLHHVFRIAMAAVAVGATLLTLLVWRPQPAALPVVGLLPCLLAIVILPPWSPAHLSAGLFRVRRPTPFSFQGPDIVFERRDRGELIFYDDDPTSTVTVYEPERRPTNRSIVVNGKSDGALEGDYPTMALSALLPALMADRHERCFVIGLGTGVTAGELAALEATREVRVAEISRGVIAALPFFDVGNQGTSRSPKVRIQRGDAYRALLRSGELYDLIVSEPSNPWVTGVENLYSREFLQAARDHLAPGGVYAQWFHVYESDPAVVALVLRTYASVFPQVSVWFALGSDLLLLGFDRPERALDVQALAERFRQPDFTAGFGRVKIYSLPALLAHELLPMGTLHASPLPGEIHTLRHPILSYRAARAFFRGQHASLPEYLDEAQVAVARRNSLLQRLANPDGLLPEGVIEAAVRETCRFDRREECATLLAGWGHQYPDSGRLRETLAELREEARGRNPNLTRARLASLDQLFGGKVPGARNGLRPAQAERLTSTFVKHYHHAVPFDRHVLESIWSRCQGAGCEESRHLVEERLGEIARRPPDAWDLERHGAAPGPGPAATDTASPYPIETGAFQ